MSKGSRQAAVTGRNILTVAAIGIILTGCGNKNSSPQPLRPQAFLNGGQPKAVVTAQTPAAPGNGPVAPPVAPPATAPAISLGTYMTIGTVVAEANGQPIYADKVLARVDPELSAKARLDEMNEAKFRVIAAGLLKEQIDGEIVEELEFAAADRAATEEEKQMASGATTNWRQKEIIKAGGSVAVARQQYAEQGKDFDEEVRQQYRRFMVMIHYQKRVFPLVSVSAEDMRDYYNRNVQQLFSEKAAVRFRLIKIALRGIGGSQGAMDRAREIIERIRNGATFAELAASNLNDDLNLRRNQGWLEMASTTQPDGKVVREPRWIERGTLGRLEAVEKAVFGLKVGELTDIIDLGDALYIAKLEEKQGGVVKPFEDFEVQAIIERTLRTDQQRALRDKERARLFRNSVHRKDERMLEILVDMALQRYGVFLRSNANNRRASADTTRKAGG
jgi:parvulin-like peptidyl-prolyl isomerase